MLTFLLPIAIHVPVPVIYLNLYLCLYLYSRGLEGAYVHFTYSKSLPFYHYRVTPVPCHRVQTYLHLLSLQALPAAHNKLLLFLITNLIGNLLSVYSSSEQTAINIICWSIYCLKLHETCKRNVDWFLECGKLSQIRSSKISISQTEQKFRATFFWTWENDETPGHCEPLVRIDANAEVSECRGWSGDHGEKKDFLDDMDNLDDLGDNIQFCLKGDRH